MLLKEKTAIIYGGGGSVGGAVARAFAREGAHVFLAGRTVEKLQTIAQEIRSNGGAAEVDVVDALERGARDRLNHPLVARAVRLVGRDRHVELVALVLALERLLEGRW